MMPLSAKTEDNSPPNTLEGTFRGWTERGRACPKVMTLLLMPGMKV